MVITYVPSLRRALVLTKSATITYTASVLKSFPRTFTASITYTPTFNRALTARRVFSAAITYTAKLLLTLEARLLPRGTGGGTTIIRKIFHVFDD